MADHDEIFLGTGAKGDPYDPGIMQRGEVVAPEPVTEQTVEVPGQLFGADAQTADADAPVTVPVNTTPTTGSNDEHVDDEHEDEVTS